MIPTVLILNFTSFNPAKATDVETPFTTNVQLDEQSQYIKLKTNSVEKGPYLEVYEKMSSLNNTNSLVKLREKLLNPLIPEVKTELWGQGENITRDLLLVHYKTPTFEKVGWPLNEQLVQKINSQPNLFNNFAMGEGKSTFFVSYIKSVKTVFLIISSDFLKLTTENFLRSSHEVDSREKYLNSFLFKTFFLSFTYPTILLSFANNFFKIVVFITNPKLPKDFGVNACNHKMVQKFYKVISLPEKNQNFVDFLECNPEILFSLEFYKAIEKKILQ